jgi:hypothetical protein
MLVLAYRIINEVALWMNDKGTHGGLAPAVRLLSSPDVTH